MAIEGYIRAVRLNREAVPSFTEYPFSIPAIASLERLELSPILTIIIGENGSGKSTLIEAIAIKLGFNAEGGNKNLKFTTQNTHSELAKYLTIEKNVKKAKEGFFLRAESFYALSSAVDQLSILSPGVIDSYGGVSLHEQSHGEAFLAILKNKLHGGGLYIFDEPEAALSPARQLSAMILIHRLIEAGSQCIMATHSPILMGYPNAILYEIANGGIQRVEYQETDHFQITRNFLQCPERSLKHLFSNE